jgi:hypothetical membrane protein
MSPRSAAGCGIAAPVVFVGGWLVAGANYPGYRPGIEHISELARVGAPTRPVMTLALLVFGVLLPVWGRALGRSLRSISLTVLMSIAGYATVGAALFPLGGPLGDGAHGVTAMVAYVGTAGSPLVAARRLTGRARVTSYAVGVTSAVMLYASSTAYAKGFWQRLGLGVVDVWFVVMALRELQSDPAH